MRFQAIAGATGTPCPAEQCVPVTQAALPTLSKLYLEGQSEKPKQQQTVTDKSLYLLRQKTTGNNKVRAFYKSSIFSTSRQACLDFLFYLPLPFAALKRRAKKSGNPDL